MFKVYDDKFLAKYLGIDRRDFHLDIKLQIKKDFKLELEKLNIKNPDIGLDENDIIYLIDPSDSTKHVKTGIKIYTYL